MLSYFLGPPLCLLGWLFIIGVFAYVLHSYDGLPERSHLGYLKKYNLEFQRTSVVDDACIAYVKKLKVKRDFFYCRADFNFNDKPIIAVIGDSHAHAFYAGIQNIAREKGCNSILLANSSCPPLKGFISDYTNPESQGCQDKIGQILETIKSDIKIDKVVMVTRGPVYIHGEVNGKFSYKSIQESLNNYRDKDVLSYYNYAKGFYSTIRVLSDFSHIKNIYYYFENPELDFEPKETIHRPFASAMMEAKRKVSKELYLMRMKRYRLALIKYSRLYKKLRFINTDDFFCHDDKCNSYQLNNFLYADDDHLSVFGAIEVAKATKSIIFSG